MVTCTCRSQLPHTIAAATTNSTSLSDGPDRRGLGDEWSVFVRRSNRVGISTSHSPAHLAPRCGHMQDNPVDKWRCVHLTPPNGTGMVKFPRTPFTVHDSRFQETRSLAPFRSEDVNLAQRRSTPKMSSAKHQTKHDAAASTAVDPLRRRILTETTYAGIHETPNTSRTYLQAAHGAEARVK